MSLTLQAEQRLNSVNLLTLFAEHQAAWKAAAQRTYNFIKEGFPADAEIRPDDVAKALLPILEVDERLKIKLAKDKLKQKFWVADFTDLIIDRVWEEISQ
jgi:hypothetical protein